MPRSPQPDMLRTQTGSDARFSQPSPGAACGAHPLSSWWRRYGVALAALGVVGLVRYLLAPSLDDRAVFMIFLGAVMLSAWYGGLRPGLLATGLSVPIILYGFLPPRYTPALALAGDSFVFVLFLAAGVAISLLIGHLHLARQRAEAWAYDKAQAEEALKVAKAEAERRTQSAEAAERLLHTLLAHVPEGITIATGPPDFPIVAHSRLALELLDRPETDLVDIPAGHHLQAYGPPLSTSELLDEQPVGRHMTLIFASDTFRLFFVATASSLGAAIAIPMLKGLGLWAFLG